MATSRRLARNANSSIKIVMGRAKGGRGDLKVQEVSVKEGRRPAVDPEAAIRALGKAKPGRVARKRLKPAAFVSRLDGRGNVLHTDEDFVNEQMLLEGAREDEDGSRRPPSTASAIWRPVEIKQEPEEAESEEEEKPHVVYDLTSEDGFRASGSDPTRLWQAVFDAVADARKEMGGQSREEDVVGNSPLGRSGLQMMGLTHSALAFLLEQMPGAREAARSYSFRHHEQAEREEDVLPPENPSGCSRAEAFKERNPLDMFSWLASRHRKRPLGDVLPPSVSQVV